MKSHVLNNKWLRFWFDISTYIDPTWLDHCDKHDIYKRAVTEKKHYVENLLYQDVCTLFDLPVAPPEDIQGNEMQYGVSVIMIDDHAPWLHFAHMIVMCKPSDVDAQDPCFQQENASYCRYVDVVQAVSSYQFYKRGCHEFLTAHIHAGLWLLWLAFDCGKHAYWSRLRLLFPRDSIESIEALLLEHNYPKSLNRNAQRIWLSLVKEPFLSVSSHDKDVFLDAIGEN